MPEIYPPTLTQCFALGNFIQQAEPNVVRSDVEVGKAKLRRRFTRAVINVNGTIYLNQAELQTFDTFFTLTLASGSKSFNFIDPVSGTEREYRFVDPPVYEVLAGKIGAWTATLALEIIP